jgi:hypothetical protein
MRSRYPATRFSSQSPGVLTENTMRHGLVVE